MTFKFNPFFLKRSEMQKINSRNSQISIYVRLASLTLAVYMLETVKPSRRL